MSEKKKVIGFTATSGDLLHAGHIAMLKEARDQCDHLIVGLLSDPTHDRADTKNKPVQSIFERYLQLKACKYVDEVIPFDDEKDLVDMLLTIMPDVRFCGEEYEGTKHTGHDIEGIRIVYNKRRHSFSSSELRDRVVKAESRKDIQK